MMKKIFIASLAFVSCAALISCGGAHGDDPGSAYMPDMYYSRAYETYNYNDVGGERDSLKARGITYTAMPVPGTIARGDNYNYHLTADSAGLAAAETLKNPFDSAGATVNMKEAERLYLINCAICHGPKLDGQGPLPKGGAYIAAPANFTDPKIAAYSDGHYFHVITFGIRQMGSYASQLRPEQRWWVIKYIRSKQAAQKPAATDSTKTTASNKPAADTTRKVK